MTLVYRPDQSTLPHSIDHALGSGAAECGRCVIGPATSVVAARTVSVAAVGRGAPTTIATSRGVEVDPAASGVFALMELPEVGAREQGNHVAGDAIMRRTKCDRALGPDPVGPVLLKPSVLERLAVRVSQAVGCFGRVLDEGRVGRLAELEEPTVLLGYPGPNLGRCTTAQVCRLSLGQDVALSRPAKYRFVVG